MSTQKRSKAQSKSTTPPNNGTPNNCEVAQLAWAAGFLDGEGCIHIAKQRYGGRRADTYRLGIYVSQNERSVLEAFRAAVGIDAPIYETKRADNHSRQCYTLNFNGHSALRLIQLVGQYLRRKYAEAMAALRFWVEGGMGVPGRGKPVAADTVAAREHYYLLLKTLK